jgi:lantibiotic modifying enzyme
MDESFDVVRGSAGTILGLLALYERDPHPRLLETASQCVQRLLNTQQPSEKDGEAWPTLNTHQQLTGYGHGASGIAYSLLRLYDVTGETQYRDSALEAVQFEQATYSDAKKHWPDYRQNSKAEYLDRWCHGRTGIGLSRLAMRDIIDSQIVERDVDRAVHDIQSMSPASTDHLCCGTTGRAMFALEVQQRLNEGYGLAHELLSNMVSRKSHRGNYVVNAKAAHVSTPSLFDGISGIGYGLLRVTSPDKLPCVLLFE